MGLFSNLFHKEEKASGLVVKSFVGGTVLDLSKVPDPVFSKKMMGDGFAILPSEGTVVAPVDAEIIQVFPTNHAVGLKTAEGVEILIHIGLETVNMQGEGFEALVQAGDMVKAGAELVKFDLDLVKEKASSTIIPCIVTNMEVVESIEVLKLDSDVKSQEEVLKIKLK